MTSLGRRPVAERVDDVLRQPGMYRWVAEASKAV